MRLDWLLVCPTRRWRRRTRKCKREGEATRRNMARRLLCRAVGVFQLSRTSAQLTGSRFYSQTEAEPLTVRQQNNGIRCSKQMCPWVCPSETTWQLQVLPGRNCAFMERLQILTTTWRYIGTYWTSLYMSRSWGKFGIRIIHV